MTLHPTSLALALAAAIGGLAALPAHAALVTTGPVSFNNSASVTDVEGGAATTSNNGALLGTSSIQQFDKNLGVLTGATLNLSSTRTQTVTVSAGAGDAPNNRNTTATGAGESTAKVTALGVELSPATSIAATGTCSGNLRVGCAGATAADPVVTNLSGSVAESSLGSYVGGGTVLVTRTADLSAAQGLGTFPGAESTTYALAWIGNLSTTYEYLLHAAPSFGDDLLTLNLDLGKVFLGDAAPSLGFSIFNAAGDRVGLDLDSVQGSGDLARLYADLAGFSALGAGASQGFLATLNPSTVGNFLTSYTLKLSDANIGAADSRFAYEMTLNLMGSVSARPQPRVNDVPEPAMLALVSAGLLGLAMTRRRTRRG